LSKLRHQVAKNQEEKYIIVYFQMYAALMNVNFFSHFGITLLAQYNYKVITVLITVDIITIHAGLFI